MNVGDTVYVLEDIHNYDDPPDGPSLPRGTALQVLRRPTSPKNYPLEVIRPDEPRVPMYLFIEDVAPLDECELYWAVMGL